MAVLQQREVSEEYAELGESKGGEGCITGYRSIVPDGHYVSYISIFIEISRWRIIPFELVFRRRVLATCVSFVYTEIPVVFTKLTYGTSKTLQNGQPL